MDLRRFRLCGLLVALALRPFGLEAQSASSFDEVGRFYMQSFGPEDYDADAQNWAIVQSLDGLVYVGNGDGVLEYDGVSWRLIPVSNRTVVRSLAVDAEGRVFVGANGELGYLAPDPLGRMRYVSLVDHIPPDAHDLRNPLTTIKNFLGLVRRDAASGRTERLERDLDRLESAADKLERLLDDLFELSRVGVQANPPEEVAFGELVREALTQLAGQVAERRVEVTVAADLPVVTGDRARLLEAVRHLLANAVQYLGDEPAPRVEVGVRSAPAPGEPPTFYVRDNGIGIDPQYHDKVFGLFERLDPEGPDGTGIGLALVQRIVEVHGGRIWVESEGAGRGSTFCFTLPVPARCP